MILYTLMDFGGGKGESAGVGLRGGLLKGQFGTKIKRYVVAHGRTLLDPSSPPLYSLVNPPFPTPHIFTTIIPTPAPRRKTPSRSSYKIIQRCLIL